jgi:hypothetical protein
MDRRRVIQSGTGLRAPVILYSGRPQTPCRRSARPSSSGGLVILHLPSGGVRMPTAHSFAALNPTVGTVVNGVLPDFFHES